MKTEKINNAYPYNLLNALAEDPSIEPISDPLPKDIKGTIAYLLCGINEGRYVRFVRMRFEEGLSLQDIGDSAGLTRERVRQIINSALKALRRPEAYDTLKHGMAEMTRREVADMEHFVSCCEVAHAAKTSQAISKILKSRKSRIYRGLPELSAEHIAQFCEIPVDDLGLSNHAKKCLQEAGIRTMADIMAADYEGLITLPGVGCRTALRITEAVHRALKHIIATQ